MYSRTSRFEKKKATNKQCSACTLLGTYTIRTLHMCSLRASDVYTPLATSFNGAHTFCSGSPCHWLCTGTMERPLTDSHKMLQALDRQLDTVAACRTLAGVQTGPVMASFVIVCAAALPHGSAVADHVQKKCHANIPQQCRKMLNLLAVYIFSASMTSVYLTESRSLSKRVRTHTFAVLNGTFAGLGTQGLASALTAFGIVWCATFYAVSKHKPQRRPALSNGEGRSEIQIRNSLYDVTEFLHRHPGGNIIKQYVGRDATDAFWTFHRNSDLADKMLASLPRSEVKESMRKPPSNLSQLTEQWLQKGHYNPSWIEPVWSLSVFLLIVSGYLVASWGYTVTGAVFTGVWFAHAGFVQHSFGHTCGTGNRAMDIVIQNFFETFLKGGSSITWRVRHSKHHAMPNNIKYDGDLRTTPFFAWDGVLIRQIPTCFLRIQHLMFVPMLGLYVPLFFFTFNYQKIKHKAWEELGLTLVHFYVASFFLTTTFSFLTFYMTSYMVQGIYLGFFFSLSHFAMPHVNNTDTDWTQWQMVSTCDWGIGNRFADFASGFLNLQCEHHVAPTMPQSKYRLIQPDLEKFCKQNGIPYVKKTFQEAVWDTLYGLYRAGHDEYDRRQLVAASKCRDACVKCRQ